MMTSPQPMPAEYLHSTRCQARALISAVENLRDEHRYTPHDFRLELQSGTPLAWADEYLASGTSDCLCHSWDIEQLPQEARPLAWQARCMCGWVSAGQETAFLASSAGSTHVEDAVKAAWALVQG
jgi:hypothetical protein